MKTRIYRIENPSAPREREHETKWRGARRTVKHDGTANVVTWSFDEKTAR